MDKTRKIIDCHNHPDWHGYNLERYLANMDQYNISKTWLLGWECPQDEHDPDYSSCYPDAGPSGPIPFSRCISYAERAPGKFILGYGPDPRRPGAIDRLKAAVDIYDVKICGELKLRMMYDNPDAIRLYRYCGEAGIPVIVHIEYEMETGCSYPRRSWWYGGGLEALERAAALCPETVLIGHSSGFWSHISGDDQFDKEAYPKGIVKPGGKLIDVLYKYPNVYCDLSAGSGCNALKRDKEYAGKFLIEFQDRVLYGRDYFDNEHQDFINELGLPEEVLDKIYFGNALKLVP